MTFNKLEEVITELIELSLQGGRAYKLVTALLAKEVTAHSVEEAETLLKILKEKH